MANNIVGTLLASGVQSSSTTADITVGAFTTTAGRGNMLAVACFADVTPNIPGITDANRTWAIVGSALLYDDTGSARGRLVLYQTPDAGTLGLTITFAGQSHFSAYGIVDWQNLDVGAAGANGYINQVHSALDAFGQTATVTLAAFSHADNGTYAVTAINNNVAVTPEAAPWVELADLANTGGWRLQIQYNPNNDTSPSCSWTGFNNFGMIAGELVQAVAGGGGSGLAQRRRREEHTRRAA